jgi:hypothetical protein
MAFTGNDPKDTYLGILTLGDDGGAPPTSNTLHPTTLQAVLDAAGNASLLELSQDKAAFTGIMEASATGIVMETGIPLESDSLVTDSLLSQSDNAVGVLFTAGDPEGSLAASVGSVALRTDGTAGATMYVKESGVGDTGWTPIDVVTTFLGLSDTPAVYSAEKWVRVNAGGTALELVDPPTVALGNFYELNDAPPSYVGFGGYVVAVNLAETGLTFTNQAVGAFTDLSDTPAALIASKYLQVNALGTALEFVDNTSASAFVGMPDTPADYTGMAGALVAVNATEDAVEFIAEGGAWGDILFFDGATWTILNAGSDGQALVTHANTGNPTWEDLGAFLNLSDTPVAYTNMEGAIVAVNAAADALEFIGDGATWGDILFFDGTNWVTLAAGTEGQVLVTHENTGNPTWEDTVAGATFVGLADTPNDYIGMAGAIICPDYSETELQFNAYSSPGPDTIVLGILPYLTYDSDNGVVSYTYADPPPYDAGKEAAGEFPVLMATSLNNAGPPLEYGGVPGWTYISDMFSGFNTFVGLTDGPMNYGSDGYVLTTDGDDTLSWAAVGDLGGHPAQPPQYDLVDEEFEVLVFGSLSVTLASSRATTTAAVVDDTPDGVITSFGTDVAGTQLGAPVEVGSVAFTAIVSASNVVVTDQGDGTLSGPNATGTISYGNGEWHIDFTGTPPDDTTDITVDFASYTGSAKVRISAYDCIRSIHGGVGPFEYAIVEVAGDPTGLYEVNSRDAYLEFDCADVGGAIILDVYVKDAYGNATYSQSTVTPGDLLSKCP